MQIFSLSEAITLLKVAFSHILPKGDLLVRNVLVINIERHDSLAHEVYKENQAGVI